MSVGLLAAACSTDGEPDEQRKCDALRAHMVDLRLRDLEGAKDGLGNPIDISAHRKAMANSLGEEFIASCRQSLTARQIECALAATDTNAAQACSSKK